MSTTPSPADDEIHGWHDDDGLAGFDGDDRIFGHDGDDVIFEGYAYWLGEDQKDQGDVYLEYGGYYNFGRGDDVIFGGEGYDIVTYEGVRTDMEIRFSNDRVYSADGTDRIVEVEFVVTSSGDDVVRALRPDTGVYLGSGADTVYNFRGAGVYADGGEGQDDLLDFSGMDKNLSVDLAREEASYRKNDGVFIGFEDVNGSLTSKNDIIGNDLGNILVGGDRPDVIDGGDGNDEIHGGLAADIIFAGGGNDLVYGGNGNDEIDARSGENTVYGGNGWDTIYTGNGTAAYAGVGSDTFFMRSGIAYGEEGNDDFIVEDQHGECKAFGGDGNDSFTGGVRSSDSNGAYFHGGQGDDYFRINGYVYEIDGGDGSDTLHVMGGGHYYGGTGNDTFFWDMGNFAYSNGSNITTVAMAGEDGDDVFNVGSGEQKKPDLRVHIDGGAGFDTVHYEAGGDVYIDSFSDYNDEIYLKNVEVINFTGSVELINTSSRSENLIIDLSHSTHAEPTDYAVTIKMNGSSHDVTGTAFADSIQISGSDMTVNAADGDDSVTIRNDNNRVYLGAGNDFAELDDYYPLNYVTKSFIDAGDGNDVVSIGVINGSHTGEATVYLGAGADELHLDGLGSDTITASMGEGADSIFIYQSFNGNNLLGVDDFDPAEDVIYFEGPADISDPSMFSYADTADGVEIVVGSDLNNVTLLLEGLSLSELDGSLHVFVA